MQQHNIAAEFIKSLIPDNISHGIADDIEDEIESHIEDKIDYYKELGYDEEEAEKKAVEDMGDSVAIKANFSRLYHTNIVPATIFPFAYAALVWFTAAFGFIYATIDSGEDPSVITVFISSLITLSIPLLMFKAYKKQNISFLVSVGITCIISELAWMISAGMYQPFLVAVGIIIPFGTELDFDNLIGIFGSFVPNILYAVLSGVWIFKSSHRKLNRCAPKTGRRHMTVKRLAIIFLIVSLSVTTLFALKNLSSNNDITDTLFGDGFVADMVHNKINKNKAEKIYDKIDNTMTYNEVKNYLLANNFSLSSSNDKYDTREKDGSFKLVVFEPHGSIINYNFIVSDTGDQPIVYKGIDYGLEIHLMYLGTVKEIKPYKFYDSLDNLSPGMTRAEVENAIDLENCDLFSVGTTYKDNKVLEFRFYTSRYSFGGNVEESYLADVNATIFLEDDRLVALQVSGMGEDAHYNYETAKEKSFGDMQKLEEFFKTFI